MKTTIAIIISFAFILRLISLNQSFWLDEATSAVVARDLSSSQIISEFAKGDFHPPLYYLTLQVWTRIVGTESEISYRLLSVVFALATIYLVYKIGEGFMDRNTGLLSALLLATAPLHIYYSQEARMYTMSAFAVTLSFYLYLSLKKRQTVKRAVFFALSIVFIAAIDYLPLLVLPVFFLDAYLSKKKGFLRFFILSLVPLVFVFVIWSPTFLTQLTSGLSVSTSSPSWWQNLGATSVKNIFLVPVKFVIGRISFDSRTLYALIVFSSLCFFSYMLSLARNDKKLPTIFWLWLLVPFLLSVVLGFFVSVLSYFRLLFILPAFYILLAAGITKSKEKYFPVFLFLALFANIVFSGIYLSNEKFHREDWREATSFVKKESEGKSSFVLFPANSQMEAFNFYDKSISKGDKNKLDRDFDIVWLMRYVQPLFDPEDLTKRELESKNYEKIGEFDFRGVVIYKYEKKNSD